MTDNPLFEETLSDLLQQARRVAERAESRQRTTRAEQPAVAEPTPADRPAQEVEPDVPPVPPVSELMRPTPGATRFLDALLGPSDT